MPQGRLSAASTPPLRWNWCPGERWAFSGRTSPCACSRRWSADRRIGTEGSWAPSPWPGCSRPSWLRPRWMAERTPRDNQEGTRERAMSKAEGADWPLTCRELRAQIHSYFNLKCFNQFNVYVQNSKFRFVFKEFVELSLSWVFFCLFFYYLCSTLHTLL